MSGHPRPIAPTKPKRKPAAGSEAAIQKQIIDYLTRIGAVVLRTNSGQIATATGHTIRLGAAGTSDLTVLHRGIWYAIEVKKPGNVATALQSAYLDRVNAAGGVGFVATSLDEVMQRIHQ